MQLKAGGGGFVQKEKGSTMDMKEREIKEWEKQRGGKGMVCEDCSRKGRKKRKRAIAVLSCILKQQGEGNPPSF